jgi:hypothetical protein
MIEVVNTTGKFTDGTPVTVRIFCEVDKDTTGDELELWIEGGGGVAKIVEIERKGMALGLGGLVKAGDVENS